MNNTIGENIKKVRKQKHMTQRELAEALGMRDAAISKYEKGIVTPPLETLKQLADVLQVPIAYLLSGSLYPQTVFHDDNGIVDVVSGVPDDVAQLVGLSSDNKAQLLEAFDKLNEDGQKVAVERVEELTEIPKYKK